MNYVKKIIVKIKSNKFWANLFKNSFWAFFGDSVASIMNLIVTIVLIHLIGDDGYGIFVLSQSYTLVMDVLLNVQCWKGVIQYGQKALIKNDASSLCGYVKLGCIFDILTAIIGGLVSFYLSSFIGQIFNWSSEMIFVSKIFSLTIFFHFSGTPTAILRIFNKFNMVALQKVIASTLKLGILTIILLYQNTITLPLATVAYCCADIVGNLLLVIFAGVVFHKKYGLKKLFTCKLPKDSKTFIKFTIWGTLSEVVDIPVNYFDVFIISLLGAGQVAVFKVFKQITSILSKLTTPIYQAIMPQFSELSAQGNQKRGYEIVIKIKKAILFIIGPIAVIIGISSPIWLNLFYGPLYAKYWYVLLLYLLIQTFALSFTTIHPYFVSLGKVKESAIFVFVSNIIYIIIALLTVKHYGMIALIIAYFIQASIVIFLKVASIRKNESVVLNENK